MTLKDFDRGFERVITPLAGLACLFAVLCHSCGANGGELSPPPPSKTVELHGVKYECFDTEGYRTIVRYVKVIAPALHQKNEDFRTMLTLKEDEVQALTRQIYLLERKNSALELDITAHRAELEDRRLQIRTWKKGKVRATAAHYIIHGVSLVVVAVLGGALVVENLDD